MILNTSSQCSEILGLRSQFRGGHGVYSFRDGLPVKTDFNSTNFLVTNFNVKEDFVRDKRSFSRENDICEEKDSKKKEWGKTETRHGSNGVKGTYVFQHWPLSF